LRSRVLIGFSFALLASSARQPRANAASASKTDNPIIRGICSLTLVYALSYLRRPRALSPCAIGSEISAGAYTLGTPRRPGSRVKSPRLFPGTPPPLFAARPRHLVWPRLPRSCSSHGYRGGRYRTQFTLAKSVCRTLHRLDPSRMSRSRDHLQRTTFAARSRKLFSLSS
jgi:hypothetical protein